MAADEPIGLNTDAPEASIAPPWISVTDAPINALIS